MVSLDNLHPGCVLCLEANILKEDELDEDTGRVLIKKGEFPIRCDGIAIDPAKELVQILDPIIVDMLGPDGIAYAARIKDPVLWAYDNITVPDLETKIREPWSPRGASEENIEHYGLSPEAIYYQDLMVRCTARRALFRVGRRSGKTWSLVIKALHKLYTEESFEILVIAPALAHLDIIFNAAMDFIKSSKTLDSEELRFVKTPQRLLELPNGSSMKGFVSGNENIRGQRADMIIIDEADYLTSDDLSSVTAIFSEHKDVILCISSTPSGSREQFWKWDKTPVFKSFHFPSMCRPNWDLDMETEQKRETRGVKYQHEILAEYGELSEGVFQHNHIDDSLKEGEYTYEREEFLPGWIYSMGVDWNPVNGTEVYVVGFDTAADVKRYRVVDKGVVYREGNTQILAIQEIIRLNRKWAPAAIFVDRGAGSMQIEYLNEYGHLAPSGTADRRLETIVEAIDFGSKIEVRHPTTGEVQRVYAKPAIVENTVRLFEAGDVQLSKLDPELERQLRGYIIDKISANGRPVYAMVSTDLADHALDAFVLALFAFAMKFSKIGEPEVIPVVLFSERSLSASSTVKTKDLRPNSRSIHSKLDEKKDIILDRDHGYLHASELSEYSHESAIKKLQELNGGRQGGKSRGSITRSNISRSRR